MHPHQRPRAPSPRCCVRLPDKEAVDHVLWAGRWDRQDRSFLLPSEGMAETIFPEPSRWNKLGIFPVNTGSSKLGSNLGGSASLKSLNPGSCTWTPWSVTHSQFREPCHPDLLHAVSSRASYCKLGAFPDWLHRSLTSYSLSSGHFLGSRLSCSRTLHDVTDCPKSPLTTASISRKKYILEGPLCYATVKVLHYAMFVGV